MVEELKEIWNWLGVPAVWGAVLTLVTLALLYLLKGWFSERAEKRKADHQLLANQFAGIPDFVEQESKALIKAYVDIFESKDGIDAKGKHFMSIVAKADNDLMKPFRAFRSRLDDETKAKIFAVHNTLAQYYPDASDEAIARFKHRKVEFYAQIEDATNSLNPDLILHRLGLVSRRLR
jgi:hypothetical protein